MVKAMNNNQMTSPTDITSQAKGTVFVFNADQACFVSAIFSSFELALDWIRNNYVTGVLTEYPLDQSCYDWALQKKYFQIKSPIDYSPIFIGRFVSVHQKFWRFLNGEQIQVRHLWLEMSHSS